MLATWQNNKKYVYLFRNNVKKRESKCDTSISIRQMLPHILQHFKLIQQRSPLASTLIRQNKLLRINPRQTVPKMNPF